MTNKKLNTEEIPNIETLTMKIGYISSGKSQIISFYPKKGGKMIDSSPFKQYPKTSDGYYNYSHHMDMREGKGTIENLKKRFKTLRTLSELSKTHTGLTETSYTDYLIHFFTEQIRTGKMDLKGKNSQGTEIILKMEWTGEDIGLKDWTPKTTTPKTPKEKTPKKDLLDGLTY